MYELALNCHLVVYFGTYWPRNFKIIEQQDIGLLSFNPKHSGKVHKLCCEQFLWNINWDLGWFWVGWQYWKNNLGQLWATFEGVSFSCYQGQKMILYFVLKHCSGRTKKLHKIYIYFFFWYLEKKLWIKNRLQTYSEISL